MDSNYVKRGYILPPRLVEALEKFRSPSKNFSPDIAGAVVVWLVLSPAIREIAAKLACSPDIEAALKQIKQELAQDITNQQRVSLMAKFSPEQQQILVELTKEGAKRLAQKK